MLGFWLMLAAIIVSLFAGFILVLIVYGGYNFARDIFRKKIPKKKEIVGNYIKENPELFDGTNPGFASYNDKREVELNEQRRSAKYREFEKIRREAIKSRSPRVDKSKPSVEGFEQFSGNAILEDNLNKRDSSFEQSPPRNTPRVKLDE